MSRQSANPRIIYCDSSSSCKNLAINTQRHPDFTAVIEIIKDKFYFATLIPGRKRPRSVPDTYLFNTDEQLVYQNFYADFGPLNIGCLYKYCCGVNQILEYDFEQFIHYTSMDEEKRANAAYLVASYAVLYLNKRPKEIYKLMVFKDFPRLKPFRDASNAHPLYQIRLIDCLNALQKAMSLGFFNFQDFDIQEYEKYEQMKHGDLTWLIPRKFIAFLGPNTGNDSVSHYPEKYINYFLKNGVAAVIRLNKRMYDSSRFTNAGLLHYDMFFPDGTVPPREILKEFLQVAENTKGAIAVHCKAGLGRTGTLIAAYVMKHYKLSAREAIAWLRICRPGSVIGHQQGWLEDMEPRLGREGRHYRYKFRGDENCIVHHKHGIYSKITHFDQKHNSITSNTKNGRSKNRKNALKKEKHETSTDLINGIPPQANTSLASSSDFRNLEDQRFKLEYNNNIKTQGDKLNEIKIMRKAKCNNRILD